MRKMFQHSVMYDLKKSTVYLCPTRKELRCLLFSYFKENTLHIKKYLWIGCTDSLGKVSTSVNKENVFGIPRKSMKCLRAQSVSQLIRSKQYIARRNFHSSKTLHTDSSYKLEVQPPSWLYVSSAIAGAYGAQVNVELDVDDWLSHEGLSTLSANLKSRDMLQDIDLEELVKTLISLRQRQQEIAELLVEKDRLLQQLRDLKSMEDPEDLQKSGVKIKSHLDELKAKISTTTKSSWKMEEQVMLGALQLPNDLHKTTPLNEPKVLQEIKSERDIDTNLSHVEIAQKFGLIKFSNAGPKAYYLKHDLVLAEMALTSFMCDFLRKSGYRHMSGPEFVKSPVVEGCGGDIRNAEEVLTMVDPHKTVIEPMNHLSGVSYHMFSGYVAKNCIGDLNLPLHMFACGRRYQNSHLPGLYGAIQSVQATFFSCFAEEELDKHFESTTKLMWTLLKNFGFSMRLVQASARDLRREERRRLDIELYSPNLKRFVPMASVSDVSDFISRRLMVTHNQNHADIRSAQRVHMIHGTALNITRLLALWMEASYTNQDSFALCSLPGVKGIFPYSS